MVISIIAVNYIWLWRQSKCIRAKLDHIWLLHDLLLPFPLDYAAITILHQIILHGRDDRLNICRLIAPEATNIICLIINCGCRCLVQINCTLFGLFYGGDSGSSEVLFAGWPLQVALLERAQTLPGFKQAGTV